MTSSDNERITFLAGEAVESLGAEDRAELGALRSLLAAPAIWEQPAPELEARIVRIIAAGQAADPAGTRATRRPSRIATLLGRRPALALGGFATVAAAAIVAIVIALSAGSGSSSQLRFAMVISGTPLAPHARGSATLTKTASGWRVELTVTGLPHIDGSRYYQAWLKNAAGVLVPIGTFNDARSVTLWSGVPVTKFRSLSVTVQRANGTAASSGRRVLTGTIR